MKLVETTQAVGHVLCHDITRIIRGQVKDTPFRKGHIVTQEDIPLLLSLGKDHLYVWEKNENMLHENEAAEILRDVCMNDHMHATDVREGKIELVADCDGLFRVDVDRLNAINNIEQVMIATRHNNFPVKKGDRLLGTRVIPLVIEKETMETVRETAGDQPLVSLLPYRPFRVGIVTTGNEVYYGRIQDTFTPVVEDKLKEYGMSVMGHETSNDDLDRIRRCILKLKEEGAEVIVCTGGMSVDPDDKTPGAIKAAGVQIVSYGAPVLPGAMFLMGYFPDGTPCMGLPGCVMYNRATVFDLVLPRVAAGVRVSRNDITRMGNGGFCLGCPVCHYPACSFGKGA